MDEKAYIVVLKTGQYDEAWPRPLAVVIGDKELAGTIAEVAAATLKPIGEKYAELQLAWITDQDETVEGPAWNAFNEYENKDVEIGTWGIVVSHSEVGDTPRVSVSEVMIVKR